MSHIDTDQVRLTMPNSTVTELTPRTVPETNRAGVSVYARLVAQLSAGRLIDAPGAFQQILFVKKAASEWMNG